MFGWVFVLCCRNQITPMKKILFLILATAFIAVSCKDKKTAQTLEGTWNEVMIDGIEIPLLAQDQIVFGACKGGKKASCDLTIIDAGGLTSTIFDYTVQNKGQSLVLKQSAGILTLSTTHSIENLTDNSMTIVWDTYIGKYEKQ